MDLMQTTEMAISMGFTVHVFGIPVYISMWTLGLAVLLYTTASQYIRTELLRLDARLHASRLNLAVGSIIGALFVLGSVVAHEMGHALMALVFDHKITSAGISWWGAYVMLPESYLKGSGWVMILVSFAGVATNLALAAFCTFFVHVLPESLTENTIQYVAYMNYRLAKFNLLPIMVLDGGKVLWGVVRIVVPDSDISLWIAAAISGLSIYLLLTR